MRPTLSLLLFALPAFTAPPPEVEVVLPVEREMADRAEFAGHTAASQTVEIRARAGGLLDKVVFQEGALVKKGDLLFQLDDRAQKAELDRAKAELLQGEARVTQANAAAVEAERAFRQLKTLTQNQLDEANAALEAAKAEVMVKKALLELAQLQLEATRITAPIDGRIGRRLVDAGNIIKSTGDTVLATIVVADPLYVHFPIGEAPLLRLARRARDDKDGKLVATIKLPRDNNAQHSAVVDFIDNKLDPAAGTVAARAVLANPRGELWPGMYARIGIDLGPPRKVLLIPRSAGFRGAGDDTKVLVVNNKSMLEERLIKIGDWVDGQIVVAAGLKVEDRVVQNPRDLKAGDVVVVPERPTKPRDKPNAAAGPTPANELPGRGPAIIVTARYLGASAAEVEQSVARPLAEQLRGLEGVEQQFSECTDNGELCMTLVMKKGIDLNRAMHAAHERLVLAEAALPQIVQQQGITIKKRPVLLCSIAVLSSDGSRARNYLTEYAEKQLRNELLRVPGIAAVNLHNDTGPREHWQLHIDRARLTAFGITAAEVNDTVQAHTRLHPGAAIAANHDPEKLGNLVVKSMSGREIRLRDVARIERVAAINSLTQLDGRPCALLTISCTTDVDVKEVGQSLQARLKELAKTLPAGVQVRLLAAD